MKNLIKGDKLKIIRGWNIYTTDVIDECTFVEYYDDSNYFIKVELPNGTISGGWALFRFKLIENNRINFSLPDELFEVE